MSIEPIKDMKVNNLDFLYFKDGEKQHCEIWDSEICIFTVSFHPNKLQAKELLRIYDIGKTVGIGEGKSELQSILRKLLDIPSKYDVSYLAERIERVEVKI